MLKLQLNDQFTISRKLGTQKGLYNENVHMKICTYTHTHILLVQIISFKLC